MMFNVFAKIFVFTFQMSRIRQPFFWSKEYEGLPMESRTPSMSQHTVSSWPHLWWAAVDGEEQQLSPN